MWLGGGGVVLPLISPQISQIPPNEDTQWCLCRLSVLVEFLLMYFLIFLIVTGEGPCQESYCKVKLSGSSIVFDTDHLVTIWTDKFVVLHLLLVIVIRVSPQRLPNASNIIPILLFVTNPFSHCALREIYAMIMETMYPPLSPTAPSPIVSPVLTLIPYSLMNFMSFAIKISDTV